MATETGPDLSGATAAVEALMDDTVLVSSNTDPSSWVLNPTTLRLEPPADTVIYSGPCKVKPLSTVRPPVSSEGGVSLVVEAYKLDIPIDSPLLPQGSTGALTSSRRFSVAVGQVFEIKSVITKTMAVQASYATERRNTIAP